MRKYNKLSLNKSTISLLTDSKEVKGGMISIVMTYFSLALATCNTDCICGTGGGHEQNRTLSCKDCPSPSVRRC